MDKSMPPSKVYEQELCYVSTREEAARLVTEALDADLSEPEPFVRLLIILYDTAKEARLKDSIYQLIKATYDSSIMHSLDLDEYMEAVREGKNIVEETRARWLARHKSEA
jgi:hypothetical protein